jgi:hypothetical protein
VSDAFERRRRSFEAEYFSRKEAHLVNKLKEVFSKKIDKEKVRKATGIKNERLLDNLVTLNVSGELLAAFNLLPLVEVAWADGAVDEREVRALMAALEQQGILPGTPAYSRMEFAIKTGPGSQEALVPLCGRVEEFAFRQRARRVSRRPTRYRPNDRQHQRWTAEYRLHSIPERTACARSGREGTHGITETESLRPLRATVSAPIRLPPLRVAPRPAVRECRVRSLGSGTAALR